MFEVKAIAWVNTPPKSVFPTKSPEASGLVRQIVDGLLFGIGQPRQHPRCAFPGNPAVGIQVPHGVTRFFKFPTNLGKKLGSGAAWSVICGPRIFDIHPESKNSGHSVFHSGTPAIVVNKISVIRE